MALFSDIDWAILLVVGAFLFFGPENRQMLRTLGRYYGRAMKLRQDLLGAVTQAAEIPVPNGGRPLSLSDALLGGPTSTASVPIAVTHAPRAAAPVAASAWTGAVGPTSWSLALPPTLSEGVGPR